MKTAEQKLLPLLQTAVNNGWEVPNTTLSLWLKYSNDKEYRPSFTKDLRYSKGWEYHSIDSLIIHWEPNQVSFLEALCKALVDKVDIYGAEFESYKLLFGSGREVWIDSPKDLHPSIVREYWINLPSSRRLNVLFELFKLLIDENL